MQDGGGGGEPRELGLVADALRQDFEKATRWAELRQLSLMSGEPAGRLWKQVVDAGEVCRRGLEQEDFRRPHAARVATRLQELHGRNERYDHVLGPIDRTGRGKTVTQLRVQADNEVRHSSMTLQTGLKEQRDDVLVNVEREAIKYGLLARKTARDFKTATTQTRERGEDLVLTERRRDSERDDAAEGNEQAWVFVGDLEDLDQFLLCRAAVAFG
jgi:hypothetical protein